jgi:hypothetical protein
MWIAALAVEIETSSSLDLAELVNDAGSRVDQMIGYNSVRIAWSQIRKLFEDRVISGKA